MAGCARVFPPAGEPLIQIRQVHVAKVGAFQLSVASDPDGWTATVIEGSKTVYSAQRCSSAAAKRAAVEFAFFPAPCATTRIEWVESW